MSKVEIAFLVTAIGACLVFMASVAFVDWQGRDRPRSTRDQPLLDHEEEADAAGHWRA
jgi:hypothetical protein